MVTTGSSHNQALPDRSVHVVLTDPPYHDDVQYGELARLFHQWLSIYRPLDPIDERQEAVSNPRRRGGRWTFQKMIAACLTESRRTLRDDGVLILTFHNKRLPAWRALAEALAEAGFVVRAIAERRRPFPRSSNRGTRQRAHWTAWGEQQSRRGAQLAHGPEEIFDNGIERRVLDKERYELSRKFMPQVVKELDRRQIRFAGVDATNFFIAEDLGPESGPYAVFFEVKRDRRRKKRMLLYVQSAYRLDKVKKRLTNAGKIRFRKLLRSTYLGSRSTSNCGP